MDYKIKINVDIAKDLLFYRRTIGSKTIERGIRCNDVHDANKVKQTITDMDCKLVEDIGLDTIIDHVEKKKEKEVIKEAKEHRDKLLDRAIRCLVLAKVYKNKEVK